MPSIWTRQPGTAVYIVFFEASTLLRLPWLCTLYLCPSMRPNCHWTFRQSLSRALLVYFGKYAATVELKTPHSLEAGTEKGRFVVIQPVKGDLYCDIPLCDPTIRPGPVGAVWHTKPITHPGHHQRGQRVFFHLRGGAYVVGDGRDVSTKFMSSLLRQSWPGSAIFCPVYRLSSAPGGRFPAAFQDAVTAYSFLVHDLHIPHQDRATRLGPTSPSRCSATSASTSPTRGPPPTSTMRRRNSSRGHTAGSCHAPRRESPIATPTSRPSPLRFPQRFRSGCSGAVPKY